MALTEGSAPAQTKEAFAFAAVNPDPLLTVDDGGRVVEATAPLGTCAPDRMRGTPAWNHVASESRTEFKEAILRAFETGKAQLVDVSAPQGPDRPRWLRARIAPGKGGALIVTSDVTAWRARLREVHHRVKNDLQVISSLLRLQARGMHDAAAREAFHDSCRRVRAVALVHEALYRSGGLGEIDFGDYTHALCRDIEKNLGEPARIALDIHADTAALDVNTAMQCGLVLHELVSNAFKHAFPGTDSGTIRVRFTKDAQGGHELEVADDGIGLPPDIDPNAPTTLGLQIVSTFLHQGSATLETSRAPRGTRFLLRIPRPT